MLLGCPYKENLPMNLPELKKTNCDELKACYCRNQRIVERRIDNTIFLVNQETNTIYYLNQLGTAIWQLLAKPISAADAAEVVRQAFPDISQKQIDRDVDGLFNELVNKRLLALQSVSKA